MKSALLAFQAFPALLLVLTGPCSRRAPAPAPSAAPSASASPLASAATPIPTCPGFTEHATPWSAGGRIRSLETADILEPAVKAAAANGSESSWSLSEDPITLQLKDAELAVASLQGFGEAAVVSFRKDDFGYCSLGAWSDQFGGAGVQLKQVATVLGTSGYHAHAAYSVMEGMNGGINGGGTSFTCKLVALFFNRHGLHEAATTTPKACLDPLPSVRFQRTGPKLFLRQGGARWEVEDY